MPSNNGSSRTLSPSEPVRQTQIPLSVANDAGMPTLGLSAAAVLVKGLVVGCDPWLPSHPKGVKSGKNMPIVDI